MMVGLSGDQGFRGGSLVQEAVAAARDRPR